jgi:integrase
MAKPLTTKRIENLKPAAIRQEIPDGGCRGLYLVLQPSGRRAWAVRYRHGGKTRKMTLSAGLTLAEARKAATAALHELERGHDPGMLRLAAEAKARQAAAERAKDTVEGLARQFIEQYAKRRTRVNTSRQYEHVFWDLVLPAWPGRSIHDIVRRDIRELVEGIAADRPVMANRTLAVLSKFFNWLCERDVIAASPCAGVKLPAKETPRDRVLSDDEIRALWLACDSVSGPAGAFVKLLTLLGQRRGEIAELRWSEVDGNQLKLSAARMKGKEAHIVPLSAQAREILASLPRTGEFVWGAAPVSHFDRIKRALDEHMKLAAPWVVHDIRRTVASGMARIGVPVPTIEKLLAHRSGTFRGIVGTYQRHSFLPEMTAAVEKWSAHIERVVAGKTADVVKMARLPT